MHRAALIFPHQLFADHPALVGVSQAVLVEEPLLFTQYAFHRQKLIFHRATMMQMATALRNRRIKVHYLEAGELADNTAVAERLAHLKIDAVRYVDPCDDWLSTRIATALARKGIAATVLDDPHFLTPPDVMLDFAAGKDHLYFTGFYIAQRKRLRLLLEKDGKPVGGKWSFDRDNRKKLPKGVTIQNPFRPREDESVRAARQYVRASLPAAIGEDAEFSYPTDHAGALNWLETFVHVRLAAFGDYEDAISTRHDVLFHSVLTPLLNVGLLSPRQVIEAVMAHRDRVPLNSLEGFLRQVIGWREFVRLVYLTHGREQRTRNYWGFTRDLPTAFYDGTTGIEPVDTVIRRVLRTGYCHHIERLMILGNFLLLCEIAPNAVYRWFMEMFIDAYDWVMVPNVYGMSQYADGGLMTTKPYISGSSYVLKMSDFKRGPWCAVWDALYWRFVDCHADTFAANPRMKLIVKMKEKLGDRLNDHLRTADAFLQELHGQASSV